MHRRVFISVLGTGFYGAYQYKRGKFASTKTRFIQQAITILEENITTHFCQYLGTDEHVYEQRKATNAYLRHGTYKDKDWDSEELSEVRAKVKRASSQLEVAAFVYKMSDAAKWIHDKRNTYNHASMGRDDQLTPEDIKTLGKKIDNILNLIK